MRVPGRAEEVSVRVGTAAESWAEALPVHRPVPLLYNGGMEKLVEPLPDGSLPKRNRGWFQPGDAWINREGRPSRSSKAALQEGDPADRAPCADRLQRLVVPWRDLVFRLSRQKAPWVINLPADLAI